MQHKSTHQVILAVTIGLLLHSLNLADEPPALNPFAPRRTIPDDAVRGFAEFSDGTLLAGQVYLTRDVRLKMYDSSVDRQREIPLRVVKRIDCSIEKEWMEREWRFRENASDVKVYTGRTYPSRLYEHTITLHDGRTIKGPLSAVIYVQPDNGGGPNKILLHKRDKGPINAELTSLVYVRSVQLGEEAYKEAMSRSRLQTGTDTAR